MSKNGGSLVTLDIRLAGQVERYHTWPTHRKQSVGEHTWQLLRIYIMIFGTPSGEDLSYIMYHDCGELVAGDLPYPVKSNNQELKVEIEGLEYDAKNDMARFWATDIEHRARMPKHIKTAELIEMAEEGLHEAALGSAYGWVVAVRTLDKVHASLGDFDQIEQGYIREYVKRRLKLTQDVIKTPVNAFQHLIDQWEFL